MMCLAPRVRPPRRLTGSTFSIGVAILVLTAACTAPVPSAGLAPPGPMEHQPAGEKRVTLAIAQEIDLLHSVAARRPTVRALVNPGLSLLDDRGVRVPTLAEAVPTLDDGSWQLFPDGRMETVWRIRPGARWHDGADFTASDLLFALEVGRDRELPTFGHPAYGSIGAVMAPDPRTVRVLWTRPYIEADALFSEPRAAVLALPLPRHLLEKALVDDKAGFSELSFWTHDYVGTGPYRVQIWSEGSHVLLRANPDYVLGRPKVDQIELRFIPDSNTLMASVLADSVDMVIFPGIGSIDQGLTVRDQWRAGKVVFQFGDNVWITMFPQFIDPRPPVIADVRFRRALVHAIDRQEMVDTLQAGMSPVAHSYMSPNQSIYHEIEAALPRYDYDPRRAVQMIEDLGYVKGPDGTLRALGTGQPLEVEVRSRPLDQAAKPAFAIADYWQRIGVAATVLRLAPQQQVDREYLHTFPSFMVTQNANDVSGLPNRHSSRTPLPQNNFRVPDPGNMGRYINAELDGLLDTYFMTVPRPERLAVLGQILHHFADQVPLIGLYYDPVPETIADRVLNISGQRAPGAFVTWNVHQWDVRS